MSQSESQTGGSTSTESESPDMDSIGIELEYPQARSSQTVPAGQAGSSGNARSHLRAEFGRGSWLEDEFGDRGGYVGSDHVGAEITSGILNLQSDEPEQWYEQSIELAEDEGFRFAASGYGDTVFGLHMHMSEMNEAQIEKIGNIANSEYGRVFFCASVDESSLDPWRHGGVGSTRNVFRQDSRGTNHYEFRLPEPVQQEHFALIMEFMRKIARGELDEAEEFARDLVYDRDERLTAVTQYNQLNEEISGWPTSSAAAEDNRTDADAAAWFIDLMEG